MLLGVALIFLPGMLSATAAQNEETNAWALASPDGGSTISVLLGDDGTLSYQVWFKGKVVIGKSPLGLRRNDQDFTHGLAFDRAGKVERRREKYELFAGGNPRVDHVLNHRSVVVSATRTAPPWKLSWPRGTRALPSDIFSRRRRRMFASWRLNRPALPFRPKRAAGCSRITRQALIRRPTKIFTFMFRRENVLRIHAPRPWAGVFRHCSMFRVQRGYCSSSRNLRNRWVVAARVISVWIPPVGLVVAAFPLADEATKGQTNKVGPEPRYTLPWTMPWRVIVLGKLAGDIAVATLVTDLAPPSRIANTSWIRPGRASWAWWSHSVKPTMAESSMNLPDFGAKRWAAWEKMFVPDAGWWNAGLKSIADHARSKGVIPLAWMFASDFYDPEKRTANQNQTLLPPASRGVKVGFLVFGSVIMMAARCRRCC